MQQNQGTGQPQVPLLGSGWKNGIIQEALTFDDILMVPSHSTVESRSQCNVVTKFSKNIPLRIPLVSSPMDTVTEYQMAIGMAQNGGLGIIHRYMSVDEQTDQVRKVKRSEAFVNFRPYLVGKDWRVDVVREQMKRLNVNSFLVTEEINPEQNYQFPRSQTEGLSPMQRKQSYDVNDQKCNDKQIIQVQLLGIITNRDMQSSLSADDKVKDLMTPVHKLILHRASDRDDIPTRNKAMELMMKNRVEKLPIVIDKDNTILALVHLKDIEKEESFKIPNKDDNGRLYVGAAVGAKEDDVARARKLVQAGCDVLVLDIANGHSEIAIKAVQRLKQEFDGEQVDIVAGSVASGEGALNLIKAGADGIRCGIGNGSICITRVVSGCGVPQFTALMDTAPVCKEYNVPLISDGGNRNSGNMCKALAVGASCIMLGRLLAGTDEGPSQIIYRDGKLLKVYRGMAGFGANIAKAERIGLDQPGGTTFAPEGVEGYIPYAGPLQHVLSQFVKGIQSGMSYSGAYSIEQLQKNVRFIRMTQHGYSESNVHGIQKI